jgi:hypothetical protein
LLGPVTAIDADAGIGIRDGTVLDVGGLGHFFSPLLPGWSDLCATKSEEAFSGATNSSTSRAAGDFRSRCIQTL